jgi:hypothetical protein
MMLLCREDHNTAASGPGGAGTAKMVWRGNGLRGGQPVRIAILSVVVRECGYSA